MTTRLRAVVHGRVQGVGFRDATARVAERAGVAGQVANLPDGTVEVELEGDEGAVGSVVEYLHHGPPAAAVSSVRVTDLEPRGDTVFRIR
ncbi:MULTISPECIES: acylphosphatase [Isoptericola]|uniref:acylphosphatase n=1 Tax=Isoptericola sediminis TaxID=2733572 RepID=A0A849K1V5_9MICO|nr:MULTISPECIES: acylphosphatase [Isoptericola]MDO8144868.1 acylphosphatase [Isoptericola sp. 178]MDO8149648.1 acylphosphatase [Isoptericola sp. b515]MDO8152582.1 acylphosphatase [Isoptericola sp. b408]NNU26250.1 acylphosphatase [Isoptericola sediminis]